MRRKPLCKKAVAMARSSLGAREKQLITSSPRSRSQKAFSAPMVASFSASVRGAWSSSRYALPKHAWVSVDACSSNPPRAVATKYRRTASRPNGSKAVNARPLRSAAATALRESASLTWPTFATGTALSKSFRCFFAVRMVRSMRSWAGVIGAGPDGVAGSATVRRISLWEGMSVAIRSSDLARPGGGTAQPSRNASLRL